MGAGRHPYLDQALPCPAVYLGEDLHAGLPEDLKARGAVALVDHWEATQAGTAAAAPPAGGPHGG